MCSSILKVEFSSSLTTSSMIWIRLPRQTAGKRVFFIPPSRRTSLMRRLLLLMLVGTSSSLIAADPPSFRHDVMAVLSRAGCNQGACHGNLNGKGGLKLSLRGEDPAFDYAVLTRDALARRTDALHPDESLLLRKALGSLPHEGGRRFGPESVEYAL